MFLSLSQLGPINPSPLLQSSHLYTHFYDLHSTVSVLKTLQEEPNTLTWNLIIESHVNFGLYRKLRCYIKNERIGC